MLINKGYGFNKHTLAQKVEFVKAMLDYPSLYLKKAVKEKIANDIAKDISTANDVFAKLAADADKPFKEKNILAIAYDWRTVFNNTRLKKADKAISFIIETMGLEKVIAKASTDTHSSKSKLQIIEGIESFAKSRKSSINDFIDLLYNLYSKSIDQSGIDEDQIQIMSMHRAKGLEWDYVVVHDATEGGFFGENNSKVTDEILEEERRLFYVAITRVKKHLFIVSADDVNRISAWYDLKTNTHPKDLKCKNSLRFLYEGNLKECEGYLSNIDKVKTKDLNHKILKSYHKRVSTDASK
jgi:DNA helicase-2/ATP-dependent DNA helicase PcrA